MSARILIVDDDVLLCDLVRMALEHAGFAVESAHSAAKALEMLRDQPVDLVLLDVMMTDINGFDMLRRMKSDPALASIPVVFLSARSRRSRSRPGWRPERWIISPSPSARQR